MPLAGVYFAAKPRALAIDLPVENNIVPKIRPLVKWTGGKYDEFGAFARYIPSFKNYYEPFFGGGGVFFALQPTGKCFLNDRSADLYRFYQQVGSQALQKQLLLFADGWEQAGQFSHAIIPKLKHAFFEYIQGDITLQALVPAVHKLVNAHSNNPQFETLFSAAFVTDTAAFVEKLKASLADKCRRIKNICEKEQRSFDLIQLADHIETGVKSGLYLHQRSVLNQYAEGKIVLPAPQATAVWYFVREFCYAAMFRFNSRGQFNIPYGGIAYNSKNFRGKVNNIFTPGIQQLFSKAVFCNLDFEAFLQKHPPTPGDFVFLDPPYDSEFSEYDQNIFGRADQERLRNTLLKLPAQWMLVIKETDYIVQLYQQQGIHIIHFDKTYTYNVRGRNNRDTRHLIICNYKPSQSVWPTLS